MKNSFDPHNPRVKKAQQKRALNNSMFIALTFIILISLLIGGGILIYFKESIGWTLLGLAAIPTMLIYWIKNDLNDVPIIKSNNFTDIISEDLLLLLSKDISPINLIERRLRSVPAPEEPADHS